MRTQKIAGEDESNACLNSDHTTRPLKSPRLSREDISRPFINTYITGLETFIIRSDPLITTMRGNRGC
jgi:hypothetical protein